MGETPDRPGVKRFEPPPWEREQFEELARRRAEEGTDSEIDDAVSALREAEGGSGAGVVEGEQERPAAAPQPESQAATPPAGKLEEAHVLEMLADLSAEEPKTSEDVWRIGLLGAIVTVALGTMLVILGAVGAARTARAGLTGVLGASILLLFGAGFVGVGVWMAVRTLKQRGVL